MGAASVSSAEYQGYTCQSVKFRRSAGIARETSWIELRLEDLKELIVKAKAVHWRGAAGKEAVGLLGIHAWFETIGKNTTTNRPQIPAVDPPDKGLNIAGDLILTTKKPDGTSKSVTYKDIFVDADGIEEVLEDLSNPTKHSEGTLRVPVTDIRAYYVDFGAIYARVNCHLRTGEDDPETMQDGKTKWTATQVFRWLFSQLPGTPQIDADCDLFKANLDPPSDLIWEGETPASCIQQLLDQYRLQAGLLPDNNYSVWRKYQTTLKPGEVFSDVGKNTTPTPLIYEKKTVTINRRPAVVSVFGRPRCRRATLFYVPCFRDIDGRVYQLKDIGAVWTGYSIAKLNQGFVIGHEKSFKDVPPIPSSGNNGRLHKARREIMRRDAYRLYAPAAAFDKTKGRNGVVSLTDTDFARFPWTPMMDAPIYLSELGKVNENRIAPIPATGADILKGDLGDFRLLPPIVHGQRVDQDFYPNFFDVVRYFNALIGSIQGDVANDEKQLADLLKKIDQADNEYFLAQLSLANTYNKRGAIDLAINKEEEKLGELFGLPQAAEIMAAERAAAFADPMKKIRYAQVAKGIEVLRTGILSERKKVAQWQETFKAYRDTYSTYGGVPAWTNIPLSVIPDGFNLDRETGLILFQQPMFHMNFPFCIDPETEVTVVEDGKVSVTFGYELKDNTPSAWTSITFCVDPEDETDSPKMFLSGVCRATAAKPKREYAPTMRLFETDLGTPMNLSKCVEIAIPLAQAQVAMPLKVEGYEYRFLGFIESVLDAGTSSVQHMFDGDAARTYIFVNTPNAMGPLGPAERPPVPTGDTHVNWANLNINREVEG